LLIEADEDVMDCPIIKLILQPIVENAVFHGLEPKMGDGLVQTTITRVNDRIRIVVEDDGLGIAKEHLMEMKRNYESIAYTAPEQSRVPEYMKPTEMVEGIGLGNIVQRLKLFYETDYSFIIDSEEMHGTTIVITVPDHIREEVIQ
jgi:two-component system sensor histidine kinase YesM